MYFQHSDVINIFGHCVFDEVVSGKNFYGIDTGCSYENKLTAIHLGTMKLYHEPMDERDSGLQVQYQRVKAHTFGEAGKNEIHMMLEKEQLFVKQAKKILDKYELTN